jgi:hypothetical protein
MQNYRTSLAQSISMHRIVLKNNLVEDKKQSRRWRKQKVKNHNLKEDNFQIQINQPLLQTQMAKQKKDTTHQENLKKSPVLEQNFSKTLDPKFYDMTEKNRLKKVIVISLISFCLILGFTVLAVGLVKSGSFNIL